LKAIFNEEGATITISYWKSLETIKEWRNNPTHAEAMEKGIKKWYSHYTLRVCKAEKDTTFFS